MLRYKKTQPNTIRIVASKPTADGPHPTYRPIVAGYASDVLRRRAYLVVLFGVLPLTLTANGQDATPPMAPTPDGGAAIPPIAAERHVAGVETVESESSRVDKRREWLRVRYVDNVTSERLLRVINTRMDEMSEQDVNRAYLREQKKVAKQEANDEAEERADAQAKSILQQRQWEAALAFPVAPQRPAFRRGFGDGFGGGFGSGIVGLAPVVDWLPSGTRLSVGPDGIGLQTGYPYASYTPYYHPYGCTCRTCGRGVTVTRRQATEQAAPKSDVWYDGLRTRRGDR